MYVCAYMDIEKISPRFLLVSKFDVKLVVGEHHFRNYHIYVIFQIFGSKRILFFLFLIQFSHFFEYEAQRRGPDHRRLHDILYQRGDLLTGQSS